MSSRADAPAIPPAPRLVVWPKRIVYIALAIALLAAARSVLDLPWLWSLGALAPVVLLDLVLRSLVKRTLPRFEGRIQARIQGGAGRDELLDLYGQEPLVHFAAPRDRLWGILGRIHAALGDHERAAAVLRDALDEAPMDRAVPLALGLGDSLFELGRLDEAERTYRLGLDEKHLSGRACANLSRIILARGGDPVEAEQYMRLAVDAARGGPLRLELARQLMDLDRREDAQWEVQKAAEELAGRDDLDPETRQTLDVFGGDDNPVIPPAP